MLAGTFSQEAFLVLSYKEYKAIQKKKRQKYRAKHKEEQAIYQRKYELKKKGFTLQTYEEQVKKQSGVCAICGEQEKSKNLAVDHNHQTRGVRGLLCSKCNLMLGVVKDNPLILQKAIAYLNK